jgi:hypothetical protein
MSGRPPSRRGPFAKRRPGWRPSGASAAILAGVAIVVAGAIAVALSRAGDDEPTGEQPAGAAVSSTPSASSAPTTAPMTTPPATSATAPPTPSPSTTPAATVRPPTSMPPSTAPSTAPSDGLDLGHGVHLDIPTGWQTVSGPDDPLTISDGSIWYSPQMLQHLPGDGPQPLMQQAIAAIDGASAAVSYSPVTFQRTAGGAVPADDYALVYSAIGPDGARLSGTIHALVRGDGLALVVDAWTTSDAWPDGTVIPAAMSDALERSLTRAPKLGPAETLPVVAPFRVTSVHPLVSPHGLAGFTMPPGFEAWSPPDAGGGLSAAGATDGSTDLVAIALPAPDTVEEVFAAVTADLDERYPGLVIDPPTAQGSREGTARLGAGFAGTLGGRPIAGGVDVWLVEGDTAFAFAYTYDADVELGGANPDPVATQFAYSAFADSI